MKDKREQRPAADFHAHGFCNRSIFDSFRDVGSRSFVVNSTAQTCHQIALVVAGTGWDKQTGTYSLKLLRATKVPL